MSTRSNCWRWPAVFVLGSIILTSAWAVAEEMESFTEPYHHIQVAASETGIVSQLEVKEGDRVKAGQVLGVLDDDLWKASLAIAEKSKDAKGAILSAKAEFDLKQDRLTKFQILREKDHASEDEVERAQMEQDVAEARLLAAHEAQEVKELEFHRAEVQLARRRILSPIDGVVIEIHKEQGEFVAPTDPVVFTVVQLDPLLATFSIPISAAASLTKDQPATVSFAAGERRTVGIVEYVSPVINPQSSTVKVNVRIANPDGAFQSGERCHLILTSRPTQISRDVKSPR